MKKYLKAILLAGWRIIVGYFTWMVRYSRHPEKYPIEKRFAKIQKLSQKVLKALNVVYDVKGLDEYYKHKKPGENTLIICNHLSDADPIVMMALAKTPVTFVAKLESKKFPFVGRVVRSLSGVFLDRNDLKQELRQMMKVQEMIKNYRNLDVIIYPEGTRNKNSDGDALEFHHGTFRPAMKSGADLAIFSIFGSQRVFNIKCKNKYNPIELRYLKTFTQDDYKSMSTPEMALLAHDMVVKSVNESRIVDKELMKKLNKKHFND
ncbi:MAG: lysophospholipid acyltransferase family protein [Bacilli bacterium]